MIHQGNQNMKSMFLLILIQLHSRNLHCLKVNYWLVIKENQPLRNDQQCAEFNDKSK
jgi:hypothetical protein